MIIKIAKIIGLSAAFILAAVISAYLTLTFIIKSEDNVIVPSLVGKDVVAALEILTELQLNTKVNGSEYSQQYLKNHVIFQEPDAGSEIKKGRDVRIIISKGARTVLMPNLTNLSMLQARMIMEENDVSRGQVSRTYNKGYAKDHIIAQVPSAGKMITRGTPVDLLVSLGSRSEEYKMPDLTGFSLDDAVLTIEKSNLGVGVIRSRFDRQKPLNRIIRQDPPAGYRISAKSPVDLVINRPARKATKDRMHLPLFGSLLQHQIDNGFLKKSVRVELENPIRSREIFNDYVKPGEMLWILIPRDQEASVFIFEDDELVRTKIYEAW